MEITHFSGNCLTILCFTLEIKETVENLDRQNDVLFMNSFKIPLHVQRSTFDTFFMFIYVFALSCRHWKTFTKELDVT